MKLENLERLLKYREDITLYFGEQLGLPKLSQGQEAFLKAMQNLQNSRALICAARGTGKTITLAGLALWSVDVLPYFLNSPYRIAVLAGSFEQSQILYSYVRTFLARAELSNALEKEPTKSLTQFEDGSYIKVLTASEKQARGQHIDLLIIDEACEADDNLIKAAFPQVATSKFARIILSSTPHQFYSYFVKLWHEAEDWLKFHWRAEDCHWIDSIRLIEAQSLLDRRTFQIEWEGIPAPQLGTIFSAQDVHQAIIPSIERHEAPTFMGVDWGYMHPTAIIITQRVGDAFYVIAAEKHHAKKFSEIQERIQSLARIYKPTRIFVDASHKGEAQRLAEAGYPACEVAFRKEKRTMLSNLTWLLEHGKLKIPEQFEELIHQLGNYSWDYFESKYKHAEDDFVDALFLAVREGAYPAPELEAVYETRTREELGIPRVETARTRIEAQSDLMRKFKLKKYKEYEA